MSKAPLTIHFFGAKDTTVVAQQGLTLFEGKQQRTVTTIQDEQETVTPDPLAWNLPYPNLALHKPVTTSSEENASCLAKHLTDGDPTTRWGSAHKDGEYVMVDLGVLCYIDHLILRWETAYATEYELALSNDNTTWRTVILSSAGGVETIPITNYQAAITNCRARYIRLTGLKRATTYGTSLYELEAYGRPISFDLSKVFVVTLSASDTVLYQGGITTLTTTAYNYTGAVLSSSDEQRTYPDYGLFTETRQVDECSASLTLVVMEIEQADSIVVSPEEVTIPIGARHSFDVQTLNQFGSTMQTCPASFFASQIGDTLVSFDCEEQTVSALIHVRPYSEINLALNRPATASGSENDGTTASKAVDGKTDTRWSSRFQDNEWIAVDLGKCYRLTNIRLIWENAYATAYDIELSDDGENYHVAKSITGAKGGTQDIDIRVNNEAVSAQFVRIFCKSRNTGYGVSLWEMEVYGEAPCQQEETLVLNHNSEIINHKYIQDGQMYISHDGVIYTVSGFVFMHAKER